MTRTQHYMHPTKSFPVYCLDWISDDVVLLGGGGGASRSGIKNMLVSVIAREVGTTLICRNWPKSLVMDDVSLPWRSLLSVMMKMRQ